MAKITLDVPDSLLDEVRSRVESGEFSDAGAVATEALRYYFERHRPEDWDEYVRKEVAWSRRRAG
jgi:Arc/MetJ-type ribon-helix-helix transcriptional regulator